MGKRRGKPHERRSTSHVSNQARPHETPEGDGKWRLPLFDTGVGRPDWRTIDAGVSIPHGTVRVADRNPSGQWRVRELPAHAIPANMDKQRTGWDTGYPAYIDLNYTCCDCKRPAMFSAKHQKRWYEEFGQSTWSGAVRCGDCRQRHRNERIANSELGAALRAYKSTRSATDALRIAQITVTAGRMMGTRARQRALGMANVAHKATLEATVLIEQLTESPPD
ncbi:MAG: hypothetical protein ACI855_005270 [Myxococcota bacterium]|jgi:hypothetical protein